MTVLIITQKLPGMDLILGPVEQLLPLPNTTHHPMSEKGEDTPCDLQNEREVSEKGGG